MYCMTVDYPREEGSQFDYDYYRDKHLPLCKELLAEHGFAGTLLRLGTGRAPGGDDLLWASVVILFESLDQMKAGLAKAGGAIGADVANYTNVKPRMSFSEAFAALE